MLIVSFLDQEQVKQSEEKKRIPRKWLLIKAEAKVARMEEKVVAHPS